MLSSDWGQPSGHRRSDKPYSNITKDGDGEKAAWTDWVRGMVLVTDSVPFQSEVAGRPQDKKKEPRGEEKNWTGVSSVWEFQALSSQLHILMNCRMLSGHEILLRVMKNQLAQGSQTTRILQFCNFAKGKLRLKVAQGSPSWSCITFHAVAKS